MRQPWRPRTIELSKQEVTMKPIVLATDGSPSAAEATLQAVELARALGAPLVALSVEQATFTGAGYYGSAEVVAELSRVAAERVEEALAQAQAVAGEAGVPCDVVHATGWVPTQICRLAAQRKARMLVIGAHGWGPLRRVLQGSVSTAVLLQAPCPVLVVRGGPELTLERPDPIETLVLS
jgi:nucleotide-binding universal stress UspA family protein